MTAGRIQQRHVKQSNKLQEKIRRFGGSSWYSMYVKFRISIPVGSGDAGNDKVAYVLPAQAATDLSGDHCPSLHIPDFGIADGPFKPNWESLGNDTFSGMVPGRKV